MNFVAHIILNISLLLLINVSHGQIEFEPDTVDTDYYFDDGGISNAKNVFKTNLLGLAFGELSVHYERVLLDWLTVEGGVGLMLPYFVPSLSEAWLEDRHVAGTRNVGYSLYLSPKFYWMGEAPELSYFGFEVSTQKYEMNGVEENFLDIVTIYGFQMVVGKRVVLEYLLGVGVRMDKIDDRNGYESRRREVVGIAMPIRLKFGFLI